MIQSSVWRVVLLCQFLVLAGNWQFFCCGGNFFLRPEKKDTVVCLAGARSLLQQEKKRYSRLSVGCAVLAITGKKRYSRLSGGLWYQFLVLAGNWQFFLLGVCRNSFLVFVSDGINLDSLKI